jgi:hypothetical protein
MTVKAVEMAAAVDGLCMSVRAKHCERLYKCRCSPVYVVERLAVPVRGSS